MWEAVYLGAERNQKETQEGARDKTLQKPVLHDLLHLGVPYDLGFPEHTPQNISRGASSQQTPFGRDTS